MIASFGHGKTITTGLDRAGLWCLNIKTIISKASANSATSTTAASSPILSKTDALLQGRHYRLGHANIQTIKKMARNDTVISLTISSIGEIPMCHGCALGKSHRAPFPKKQGMT